MTEGENVGSDPIEEPRVEEAVPGIDDLEAEPVLSALDAEVSRKKAIRKNMAGNQGEKTDRIAETQAGCRDTREQPDFEDHSQDEVEEHGPAGTEE